MAGTAVMFVGTISIDGGPPRPFTATGVTSPLGIWSGPIMPGPPVDPGYGVPIERPSHPIYYPPGSLPHPEHPIVIIPPGAIDGAHPEHPIYLPVYPAHPIELPPEQPADPGFQWVYTDQYGWVMDPVGGGKPRPLPPGGSTPSP